MLLDKRYKIEKVVSKDNYRVPLLNPYIDDHDGGKVIVATNGRSLVKIKVNVLEGENIPNGYVDKDLLKESQKRSIPLELTEDEQSVNGMTKKRDRDKDIYFPRWQRIIPEKGREIKLQVMLNAKKLYELSQAMGEDVVTLSFENHENAIEVTNSDKNTYGLIMPCKL